MGASDILLASIGDLTVAESLSNDFLELLADRKSLPSHPALKYMGAIDGRGSNVIKVPHLGLRGYDNDQQVADGSAPAATALTDGSSTITVVKFSTVRTASDLARMVAGDKLNQGAFVADAVQMLANRQTDLTCDAIDGFTLPGGTSGSDLDTADIVAALGVAEVGDLVGPYMGLLHGKQWGKDLQVDMVTGGIAGPMAFQAATAEMIGIRGGAFKGTWLNVDWFVSNRVNSNGTDRLGAIWGPGAVVWADGMAPLDDPSQQLSIAGKILFERDREAKAGVTSWVYHYYLGVALGIQNGVTIGSSAT
jgi:hypothetical protein